MRKLPYVALSEGQTIDVTTFPDGTYALVSFEEFAQLVGTKEKNAFPWRTIVVEIKNAKSIHQVKEHGIKILRAKIVEKVYIAPMDRVRRAELDLMLAEEGIELFLEASRLMKFNPTDRGFARYQFKDRARSICSLQKSSIATEDCIWLGVDEVFDHSNSRPARMHLTQEQVAALLPQLEHFAQTGKLQTP